MTVLSEPAPRIWGTAWAMLRESGWLLPAVAVIALLTAAFGTVLEALLFRGLFDMGRHLQSTALRLGAVVSLLLFLGALLALDWPAELGLLRLGRYLELHLRTRFLLKVPRLEDRHLQSRSISDMAFRAHGLQLLRQLPEAAGYCLHLAAGILCTGIAIAWIYPGSALLAALAVAAACGVPALFLPSMGGRDLRYRAISAALGSFYLDSLLGSRAIQAHGAQRAMRAAQARQLRRWAEAGLHQQRLFVAAEAVQMASTFAVIVVLVYRQAAIAQSPAGLLLLIYWAISIPLQGQEVARIARSFPAMRNTLLRFLELVESPENDTRGPQRSACAATEANRSAPNAASSVSPATEAHRSAPNAASSASAATGTRSARGVKVDIDEVSVIVGGHTVLEGVTLHAQPGEHIGIVGASGAGKSSLVGCLLGWYQPASGSILVDDAPLDPVRLAELRRETAWVDPQVHLFRTTLFENLRYGNGEENAMHVAEVIESAELERILERSPEGLQTPLGDGGTLISGGEGQRIRAARALGRSGVRLVILDEPVRGLARDHRRRLLATLRRRFAGATLFCVTHDVADTLDFDRVVVIESGRVVEQGPPQGLCATAISRYRQLLEAERSVGRELWAHPKWRRVRLHGGALTEAHACGEPAAHANNGANAQITATHQAAAHPPFPARQHGHGHQQVPAAHQPPTSQHVAAAKEIRVTGS